MDTTPRIAPLEAPFAPETAAELDRWMPPGRLLGWLGWGMGLFCFALASLGPATPPALVVVAVLACSATAVGWNGVFFAGLARLAPPGRMAALSGGAQVFTFAGGMIGPLLFGELVRLTGSYPLAYALFALLPAAMGTVMWRAHRGTGGARSPAPSHRHNHQDLR